MPEFYTHLGTTELQTPGYDTASVDIHVLKAQRASDLVLDVSPTEIRVHFPEHDRSHCRGSLRLCSERSQPAFLLRLCIERCQPTS